MTPLQPVRGTRDILGDEWRRHRRVVETAREVAHRYAFEDVDTPVFEFTPVFARTMGEGSDVVRKEMYTFVDRGEEEVTLRPEYTAGICRAFISNGWQQHLPLKLFAAGPMFRYERPQKGRLRQFHQIDAEILGVAGPQADIEVIALGADILDALGVLDKCTLELNTLGDVESRTAYRAALVEYFAAHQEKLSADSKDRLERNPLRILDSKDEGDRAVVAGAPPMEGCLNAASAEFFATVKRGLDAVGVAYQVNPRLVRGLDYYTHTAFEFTTTALGAQGAVIAGGRYDGLIETLGGPSTPGIGWAGGIERLAMLIDGAPAPARPIALAPLGAEAEAAAWRLARALRRAGFTVDIAFAGNLKRRLARANKIEARAAVILGDSELARGVAQIKDLESGEQSEAPIAGLVEALRRFRA